MAEPTKLDHLDPADIAFTLGHTEPLMLATDGGVHLTKDQGKQWTLTGSNVGGFVALQVGEMTDVRSAEVRRISISTTARRTTTSKAQAMAAPHGMGRSVAKAHSCRSTVRIPRWWMAE